MIVSLLLYFPCAELFSKRYFPFPLVFPTFHESDHHSSGEEESAADHSAVDTAAAGGPHTRRHGR